MKWLAALSVFFLFPSVAFGSDTYSGTRFCDAGAYGQISTNGADRENAHVFRVSGTILDPKTKGSITSLCRGPAALRSIKATLIAYDPSFAAGLVIDKVANYRNALNAAYIRLAQGYFAASSRSQHLRECTNYRLPEMISKKMAVSSGGYFGLELKNPDDLDSAEAIQKYKLTEADLDASGNSMEPAQVIALKLDGKWTSIMVPAALIRKFYFNDYPRLQMDELPFHARFLRSSAFTAVDSETMAYWQGSYRLTPLRAACVGDACTLRNSYLFSDLPDDFQKDTLQLKEPLAKDPVTHQWSIEAESRDADAIWDAYMTHFTTVKEAQVPSEKLTKYEVELDLEPFCRFALPRKDMLTP